MRVLVTFAVDAEFAPWRNRHPFLAHDFSMPGRSCGGTYYGASIRGCAVVCYLTGIGLHRREDFLRKLMGEKPDICISSGLAGGLKPGFNVGEIVAARFVRHLKEGKEGSPLGSNSKLLKLAEGCGAKVAEICITSPHIVSLSQHKRAMGEFADVVEMESYLVMRSATGSRVRAITLRAISDTVYDDLPIDFGRVVDEDGRVATGRLVRVLAKAPHKIPSLVRFGRESKNAANRLADFLDRYLDELGQNAGEDIPRARERVGLEHNE